VLSRVDVSIARTLSEPAIAMCSSHSPLRHVIDLYIGVQCGDGFWISGFRTTDQPTCIQSYYWAIDGLTSVPMTYRNWVLGHGDPNCGAESCVLAYYPGSWGWADSWCPNRFCAICELEMV